MNKFYISIFIFLISFFPSGILAQDLIVIEPLFEYPVAPEELESITDRCDYLVAHFWDNFDLKSKNTVDQNALNHAFNIYITSLNYATPAKSDKEIKNLLSSLSKNPVLLTQFVKAAEENIFSARADYWNDDLYLMFLETFLKNKNIKDARKNRYRNQYDILQSSKTGAKMPEFDFEDSKGNKINYFPMSTPTLLIFGNPGETDWRMARLKMETNSFLNQALDKGSVNIIYIVKDKFPAWEKEISNYPTKWITGYNPEISKSLDLRLQPSIYLVGSDGTILMKNVPLDIALEGLAQQISK